MGRAGRAGGPGPTRRGFLVGGVAAVGLGGAFWADLLGAAPSRRSAPAAVGYGPRLAPDEHGIRLPEGFRSRLIARGGEPVAGTGYRWHEWSDGSATFPVEGGGFILVSNAETLPEGGASAIRFDARGEVEDAYPILSGTRQNCSGGGTPWGTWLSCEEVEDGLVWECDPTGRRRARPLPAMGVFKHEAAAVDPRGKRIYLTEDLMDGCFYRYTPRRWPELSEGLLEIAVAQGDRIAWEAVPDPAARRTPIRRQVDGALVLKRGEGIWHDGGTVYVATTGDHRVHAYDIASARMRVLYDGLASASAPLLRVDQITANRAGEVFICEDLATKEIHMGVMDRRGRVAPFLSVTGAQHERSELTGVAFDPSGRRMFFASQRAFGKDGMPGPGAVYEITGPFRA
jgi:uncharacterized protein